VLLSVWWPSLAGFALGSLLLGLPFTAITLFAMQEARRLMPHNASAFIGLLTARLRPGPDRRARRWWRCCWRAANTVTHTPHEPTRLSCSDIQWFPGHMHATRQALAKRLPDIDVVIELLDARLPGSSANPLLAELLTAGGKPALKVLNKQDLADPDTTALWLAHCRPSPAPTPWRWTPAKPPRRAIWCPPAAHWRRCAAAWSSRCGC
jgi:hypothetical protein